MNKKVKRNHKVDVRLNDAELAKLQSLADKQQISLSESIRYLIQHI